MNASTIWFDAEGVLYSVPKEGVPVRQSMEEIRVEMQNFRKITGGGKVCIIIESSGQSEAPRKEQRDFIADEISSVTKAMAIISSSPLSRMVANLFFSFKPPSYPFKIFSNAAQAKEWITQYL